MYPFAVRSILLTHLHFLTWEITLRAIPWLCLLIVVDYGNYGLIARKKELRAKSPHLVKLSRVNLLGVVLPLKIVLCTSFSLPEGL